MENKSTWGGARKGAGAPVRLADADKRKNRAIPFSDKEWAEIGKKAGNTMSKAEFIRNAVFTPKKEKNMECGSRKCFICNHRRYVP